MRQRYESRIPALDTMVATPAQHNLAYLPITVTTPDSITISTWFMPTPEAKATLLMVHGFMMNKSHMLQRARYYHQLGFNILAIDLRARGESSGQHTGGMGKGNAPDVLTVISHYQTYLSQNGPLIGYGFSHGGRTLIHASAALPQPLPLILEGTPYSLAKGMQRQYHMPQPPPMQEENLDEILATIPQIPILLLIGDSDTAIIPEEAQSLIQFTTAEASQLVVFPNTQHNVVTQANAQQLTPVILNYTQQILK
ncbi:MAG TPA: hypothetical protein DCP28_19035 [Cytophagales bacterium]|nr:hypothetical protein [Cytophagales bacterium]